MQHMHPSIQNKISNLKISESFSKLLHMCELLNDSQNHERRVPVQVLSHNLYTVLCIPHDPVALEDHFRDDDDGPVSSQGYMPYLNKYILDKVIHVHLFKVIHVLLVALTPADCPAGCRRLLY